jgi:hypothetical protein
MKEGKLLTSLFLIAGLLLGCQRPQLDWPKNITSAIWVPKEAWKTDYRILEGSYQVAYSVTSCYPAYNFIDIMVSKMASGRWRRLDFDFLNPKIRLNHARALGGTWSHIGDQDGNDVYQWIDDWEDSEGDLVRYWLRFRAKDKVTENTCTLEVVVIYIPAKIRLDSKKE